MLVLFISVKGIVHLKKYKMMSSFTHSPVVPNLYELFSYAEHKRIYIKERR